MSVVDEKSKKKVLIKLILLAVVMIFFCFIYIVIKGDVFYAEYSFYYQEISNPEEYSIKIEQGSEHISVEDFRFEGNTVKFTVHALSEGKAEVWLCGSDDYANIFVFYVNRFGFITKGSLFGECNGGNIIIIMVTIYAAVILYIFIRKFMDGLKADFYSYHNITLLGMIIFISLLIVNNLLFAFKRNGLLDFINGILNTSGLIIFIIPFALLVAVLVFISNIVLVVKEGANKKNILGTVFSFGYILFLIFPFVFEGFLQIQTFIDVHKENGFGHYLDIIVTNFCYSVTAYMTVILIATIVLGIRAAHRRPAFNKDFIIILGCRIRKDGSVTPLLKGRADAAIRFSKMQEQATGKRACFVTSGGKGGDEVISEGEAIRNYLLSCDIDESRIIPETESKNTDENFSFSLKKIKGATEGKDAEIAFSTSGYHVFRSGYIASNQGIRTEGIGAKTKVYFWINAFIRELIATLHYEKKKHLMVVATLFVTVAVMGSILFMSVLF